MAFDIKGIDFEPTVRDKVLFAVVALPLLSAFGTALRVVGVSEPVTLMVVIPLLCVAFFAWHIGADQTRTSSRCGVGAEALELTSAVHALSAR